MKDDLSSIGDLIYEVDCGACDLDSFCKGGLMNMKSIEAIAAEGWDEGWVNVDDSIRVFLDESLGEDR